MILIKDFHRPCYWPNCLPCHQLETAQAVGLAPASFVERPEVLIGLFSDSMRHLCGIRLMLHMCTSFVIASRSQMTHHMIGPHEARPPDVVGIQS